MGIGKKGGIWLRLGTMNIVDYLSNLYLYKYENVCVFVCVFFRVFLGHFGIRLGYPLAQMCFDASKWF